MQTWLLWRWPLQVIEQCRRRYGSAFTLRPTSTPPLSFLSDPCDIKAVFAAAPNILHPGEGGKIIAPIVGECSFMLLDDAEHLAGRRVVMPPFHASAVQRHAGLVVDVAGREAASWPLEVPFAVHPRLRALALEIILRASLATHGYSGESRLCELHRRVLAMLTVTSSPAYPEPLLRHGPGRRTWTRFLRQRASADELIYTMIAARARYGDAGDDLVDRLLSARHRDGSRYSAKQVRDDFMSIVLAGHETTSSQIAWAFQLLAHHPSVQERLAEELDAGEGGEYLTATVKEVLRHRPVFLFAIPRAVKQPIEIGRYRYTPPAQLLACIYLLHHDPALYPDPEAFRPERFLGRSPDPWLPWGGGRKRCPGVHLAMLEIETVLRTVLATMTIRPAQREMERARWRTVIVTPHAGCRVVLQPRCSRRMSATRH